MGKITTLVTSLLIMAIFVTGIVYFLGGLDSSYAIEEDGNFSHFYIAVNTSYSQAQTLQTQFEEKLDSNSTFNPANPLQWYSWGDWIFKSFASTIRTVGSSATVATGMISSAGDVFQIQWASAMFIAVVGVTIVLLIVGFLIHRDL
jgi:hypothetical protein